MTTNDNGPRSEEPQPDDGGIPVVPPIPPDPRVSPDAPFGAPGYTAPGAGQWGPGGAGDGQQFPPGGYPGTNGGSPYGQHVPPDSYPGSDPRGQGAPAYGQYPAGGNPYGSGGYYHPGMLPPEPDSRPPTWWGILAGVLVIVGCVIFYALMNQQTPFEIALFSGVTMSFAALPIAATIAVIPRSTRRIGQGLFIVLGALPLIWFGVCVQAMSNF